MSRQQIEDPEQFQSAVKHAKILRRDHMMSYDAIAKNLMNSGYRTKTGLKVFGVGMVYRMCRGDFG